MGKGEMAVQDAGAGVQKPRKNGKGGKRSAASTATATEAAAGPANKKRKLKLERRQAKPHADLVGKVLRLWNQLREKTVPDEERETLIREVVTSMRGNYPTMCLKHDTSRAVQAVVMYGNDQQVAGVAAELEPNLGELATSQYAHFVVLKLIKHVAGPGPARRDLRKSLVRALAPQVERLAVHAVGARVVETALAELPKAEQRALRSELFGREHLLATTAGAAADRPYTLRALLKLRPDRREVILGKTWGLLSKMIDKTLCQFQYVQELLCEYLEAAGPTEAAKVAPLLAEQIVALLASRAGAKAAALLAAYSGARERKRMTKALKGHVRSCLFHREAYIFLTKLADATDDTVNTKKHILAEIFEAQTQQFTATGEEREEEYTPEMLATSASSTSFFLWFLAPNTKRYMHDQDMKAIMAPSTLPPPGTTVELRTAPEDLDTADWVSTSKKAPDQRRRELLSYLRSPLIELCVAHAPAMLQSPAGGRLLFEVARTWKPEQLHVKIVEEMTRVPVAADETDVDGGAMDEGDATPPLPIWEHPKGHLTLKWLFLAEAEAPAAGVDAGAAQESSAEASLATAFVAELTDELLCRYLTVNRGAFVIEALAKVTAVQSSVLRKVSAALKGDGRVKAALTSGSKGLSALQDAVRKHQAT